MRLTRHLAPLGHSRQRTRRTAPAARRAGSKRPRGRRTARNVIPASLPTTKGCLAARSAPLDSTARRTDQPTAAAARRAGFKRPQVRATARDASPVSLPTTKGYLDVRPAQPELSRLILRQNASAAPSVGFKSHREAPTARAALRDLMATKRVCPAATTARPE